MKRPIVMARAPMKARQVPFGASFYLYLADRDGGAIRYSSPIGPFTRVYLEPVRDHGHTTEEGPEVYFKPVRHPMRDPDPTVVPCVAVNDRGHVTEIGDDLDVRLTGPVKR